MVNGTAPPEGSEPALGLRERKKQRTRETIARAALELFDRDGFHETTIPAIAAAADVSPRTVSSYFPSKEDLVFPDQDDAFARLSERLAARADGQTTADALRAWVAGEVPLWAERDIEMGVQRRVVDSDPGLQAREQRYRAYGEELIATSIGQDLGMAPDGLEARMAAAATFAIFGVLGAEKDRYQGACEAPPDEPVVLQLLDRALRFVDAGIRSLREDAPAA